MTNIYKINEYDIFLNIILERINIFELLLLHEDITGCILYRRFPLKFAFIC